MSNNMLVQSSMSEVPSTNRFTSVNSSTSSEVPSTSRFTSSNQSTNRPTTNSNSLDELYMSMVYVHLFPETKFGLYRNPLCLQDYQFNS